MGQMRRAYHMPTRKDMAPAKASKAIDEDLVNEIFYYAVRESTFRDTLVLPKLAKLAEMKYKGKYTEKAALAAWKPLVRATINKMKNITAFRYMRVNNATMNAATKQIATYFGREISQALRR